MPTKEDLITLIVETDSLQEAWPCFKCLESFYPELEKYEDKIKNGIKIHFDLRKYFQYKDSSTHGVFRRKPKADTIRADKEGHVPMAKMYNELDDRLALIKYSVLKCCQSGSLAEESKE